MGHKTKETGKDVRKRSTENGWKTDKDGLEVVKRKWKMRVMSMNINVRNCQRTN